MGKLTLVNADTGDQVTRWLFGTTLADSAIASNGLVRAKIYPESDDRPAPASDGPEGVYSRLEYQYNRQGQQTQFKDADGTTHAYAYDKSGAMTEDRVTALAAGLSDDVLRIGYTYDNRSLMAKVTSYNAASGGSIVNEVGLEYDSFLQLATDKQSHSGAVGSGTPKVTYTYEAGGPKNSTRRTAMTYPDGRVLERAYGTNSIDDHLSRVKSLKVTGEAFDLVSYLYMGTALQVKISYAQPGVDCLYRRLTGEPVGDAGDPYTGYDRFGRSVDIRWRKSTTDVARMQYGFDRDSRRTWRRQVGTTGQDQHYGYDALSQVTDAERGTLNLNLTAVNGIPANAQHWEYDPTGNWRGFDEDVSGAEPLTQTRVHDRGNRLTQVVGNPTPVITDRAGRIHQSAPDATGDWNGSLHLMWDAWSRVVQSGTNGYFDRGIYQYDGLHRRVIRNVDGAVRHVYYSDAWRPVEERDSSLTTVARQYLWGARHRDDLVRYHTTLPGVGAITRYVMMDYFNPAALTDTGGVVKERYTFSAFGVRSILGADYTGRTTSESQFEFAFQGQFLDAESGLYNYGYRYYSPYLGRWTCKDPIGENGGFNLYACVNNRPVNLVDRLGLAECCVNGAKMAIDAAGRECCPDKMGKDAECNDSCVSNEGANDSNCGGGPGAPPAQPIPPANRGVPLGGAGGGRGGAGGARGGGARSGSAGAAAGGQNFTQRMMNNILESIHQGIKDWFDQSTITFDLDFGAGPGAHMGLDVPLGSKGKSGLEMGLGFGIGAGAAIGIEGPGPSLGNPGDAGIKMSGSAGNGVLGGSVDMNFTPSGLGTSGTAGWGIGSGASATLFGTLR